MNRHLRPTAVTIVGAGFLLQATCSPDGFQPQDDPVGVIINKCEPWGDSRTASQLACSLSVKDNTGEWVTGLGIDNFALNETLLSSTGTVLDQRSVTFDQPDYQFSSKGFWERSVGERKLDLIFVVDGTGSMENTMPHIRSEADALIDRLLSNHSDFRVGAILYGAGVNDWGIVPFHGLMEVEELRSELDQHLETWGEWWAPTVGYDALLLALNSEFREEADKVAIIITDTLPQSAYDAFWYSTDCTAATGSAVEAALEETDARILYCQPNPARGQTLEHLDEYVDNEITPKAVCYCSPPLGNFESCDCGFAAFATGLGWPFSEEHLATALGLAQEPIARSEYYLAWKSGLEPNQHADASRVRVSIEVDDATGNSWSTTFAYDTTRETLHLDLTLTDELGRPAGSEEAWVYIYNELGDRKEVQYWQLHPDEGGKVGIIDIPTGSYWIVATDDGDWPYTYSAFRYIGMQRLNLDDLQTSVPITLQTRDHAVEFAKVRGLLNDLRHWRVPGDVPFDDFVEQAQMWVDSLEVDGVTWEELAAVKRFYIVLSGYVNITEYAQIEIEGALDDFDKIVDDIRSMIQHIKAIQDTMSTDWKDALLDGLISLLLELFGAHEVTAAKEAVELGLERLLEYAQSEVIEDIVTHVISQIPSDSTGDLAKALLIICIEGEFVEAKFEDWGPIVNALRDLFLVEVLEEAVDRVTEELVDSLFADLAPSDPLQAALLTAVQEALEGFIGKSFGDFEAALDHLDETMQQFSHEVGDLVLEHGHDAVVEAVDPIFDQVHDQLSAGDVRDLLMGMARDLIIAAVPDVETTTFVDPITMETEVIHEVDYRIDTDLIVEMLIRNGLYHVVLKRYFVQDARDSMFAALDEAQGHVPLGGGRDAWSSAMDADFSAYRSSLSDLQVIAWDAMTAQEIITDWAETLEILQSILTPLGEALDLVASVYPSLDDTTDAVHGFITALDGFQVLGRAVNFGLKTKCLDDFGNQMEPLYQTVFSE